jgi:hydroxypyruvate reductase
VHLIDKPIIDAVGKDGLVVNISRGAVIDEDALIQALKTGRFGHAALDVFAQEPATPERWRDVPNVILTPHVAGVTHESVAHLREAAARNPNTLFDGTPLVNAL